MQQEPRNEDGSGDRQPDLRGALADLLAACSFVRPYAGTVVPGDKTTVAQMAEAMQFIAAVEHAGKVLGAVPAPEVGAKPAGWSIEPGRNGITLTTPYGVRAFIKDDASGPFAVMHALLTAMLAAPAGPAPGLLPNAELVEARLQQLCAALKPGDKRTLAEEALACATAVVRALTGSSVAGTGAAPS